MTTVNLGRIKSVWRGTWASGIAYSRDDVVQEGVNSYICVQAHTSGSTFAGDSANWNVMAQGAELPAQSGNSGLVLKTNGSSLYWDKGGRIGNQSFNYTDSVGSYSNVSTHLTTYINTSSNTSGIWIEGVITGMTEDDSTVYLEYNINGGAWQMNNKLNSRSVTYAGLGDFAWAHKSNDGPFPFSLTNYFVPEVAGTIGIRVKVDVEGTSNFFLNRGTAFYDNGENGAAARSRIMLTEILN